MTDVPLTLYARLRDDLRAQILDGRLQPMDKLPSESRLSELHGVSRITVRQALADLQNEGLILRQQGKGAFVSRPQRASQNLNRLQGLGESLAAQGKEVSGKRLLMKRRKAPAEVAAKLALPAGSEVYQMMSLRYVNREPISVNVSYFPAALGERVARIDLSGRDLIDVLEKDLGQVISRADLDISAGAAGDKEASWLQLPAHAPALVVRRTLFDAVQCPLHWETVTYRAEAFSYCLSVTR